jgi:alpha-D-xyloside xylohydrolase
MINRIIIYGILFVTLLLSSCGFGKREVSAVKNGIEVKSDKINLRVQFYTDNTVRVLKWAAQGTADKNSLAVIKEEIPELQISTVEDEQKVILQSEKLKVYVFKKDFRVEYKSVQDLDVLKEFEKPEFTPVVYDSDSGFTVQQYFSLAQDEGVYGLGQHQYGYFNYRNKEVVLVQ